MDAPSSPSSSWERRGGNVSQDQTAIATAKEEKTKRFHKVKGPGGGNCTSDAPCAGGGEGEALSSAGSRLRAQEGQWPCSGRRLSWQPGTSSRDCYLHGSYREDSDSGGGGLVTKSCLTLCDPMDCRVPSSSVLRIFISFSRGSS